MKLTENIGNTVWNTSCDFAS